MIKNIIFDIGNVILDYLPRTYLEGRYPDASLRERLFDAVFASEEWRLLDQGLLTYPNAIAIWSQRHPGLADHFPGIMADWYNHMSRKPDTISLMEDLKAAGQRIFYLSNFPEEAFLKLRPGFDFWPCFDGGILSCDVKLGRVDTSG